MKDLSGARRRAFELLALSFITLFLELMIIRWIPGSVLLVAYFANLMLISSFLGIGLGALLKDRAPDLFPAFPFLLVFYVVFVVLSEQLSLPSSGGEHRFFSRGTNFVNVSALVVIFVHNTLLFAPLGQRIGRLFDSLPPLRAYAWDLGGSLLGTIAFGVFSFAFFAPVVGMVVVMAVYLWVAIGHARSGPKWLAWAGVAAFAASLGIVGSASMPDAIWSPYHYVTVHSQEGEPVASSEVSRDIRTLIDPPTYSVRVNGRYYQLLGSLDPMRFSAGEARDGAEYRLGVATMAYRHAASLDRVLVVGAGGGKDVQAALLMGAKRVDAVEIDPVLIALSKQISPSGIYFDRRVHVHTDDARAFFSRDRAEYDVVVFGSLDSQALFSAMSSIRLDGFVYTVESFRSAWARVREGGVLALEFQAPKEWLQRKLVLMMMEATGQTPVVYRSGGSLQILAAKGAARPLPATVYGFDPIRVAPPSAAGDDPPLATDDWPFLYLRERNIPQHYLIVIVPLLLLSVGALALGAGEIRVGPSQLHFAALGMGFLLLQTKSITDCSLYFGATWLVTTLVVAGILFMVFCANFVAMRLESFRAVYYAPLAASLLLLWIVPNDAVLSLPAWGRAAFVLCAVPLPVFFAGIVFSTTFRDAERPSLCFGANLIGSAIGGFAEYAGMWTGYQALSLLVAFAYLASFVAVRRIGRNKGA